MKSNVFIGLLRLNVSPVFAQKRKKKGVLITENVPINIIVTFGKNRVDLFSGYRIDLNDWNPKKKIAIAGSINKSGQTALEINNILDQFVIDLKRYFRELISKGEKPTKEGVKAYFRILREKHNPENLYSLKYEEPVIEKKIQTFFEVYEDYLDHCRNVENLAESTMRKKESFRETLRTYDERLSFEMMDSEGLSFLLNYFIVDLEWKNSTTKRQLVALKTFLRYAYDKGALTNKDFLQFKPNLKTIEKKVVFLTLDEINHIRNIDIPEDKEHLKKIRDILIFTCFTGLRFSDVQQLRKTNIINGKIHLVTQKTSDPLIIELNDVAREILKKYKDAEFKGGRVLPVKTNQETNRFLKDLGELAELDSPVIQYYCQGRERKISERAKWEYLSTHIGRRSFICMCISKGISIPVIMKWTGPDIKITNQCGLILT